MVRYVDLVKAEFESVSAKENGPQRSEALMTNVRCLMVLLSLIPPRALAQELSAEDRACVNAAIDKLPRLEGLTVEGSRIVMSNPEQRTRNKLNPYTATVEINASLRGAKTTHSFFCHGDTITMRALPIEVH